MRLLEELGRRAPSAIVPVLCACAISYFGYHAIEGDRGLYAYARLSNEVTLVQQALAETALDRRRMERRVALLRADRLDLDMLDEQSRSVLGVVRADELVIYGEH